MKKIKNANKDGFLVSLIKLLNKLIDFLLTRSSKKDEHLKQLEIENARKELKKALVEGRIGDIAYWKEKLKQLSIVLIILLFVTGCVSREVQQEIHTIAIGERIMTVKPGELIKIPDLISPAKTWYLIDNEGMYQLFDIDINNTQKKNIKMIDKTKTHGCLYRLIGRCKNCTIDEDTSHHPNNYDCPNFKPIGIFGVKISQETRTEKE